MNMRDNSDKHSDRTCKATSSKEANKNSQLLNYTHKSKRLMENTEKPAMSKSNSKAKRKLNNSTSCNLKLLYDKQMLVSSNKTKDLQHMRGANSSMSNLSVSGSNKHNVSKSKKKKKKGNHMKSQSGIPINTRCISERLSEKKQATEPKVRKKKSSSKHAHHKSDCNPGSSKNNKNNLYMINSAIGKVY